MVSSPVWKLSTGKKRRRGRGREEGRIHTGLECGVKLSRDMYTVHPPLGCCGSSLFRSCLGWICSLPSVRSRSAKLPLSPLPPNDFPAASWWCPLWAWAPHSFPTSFLLLPLLLLRAQAHGDFSWVPRTLPQLYFWATQVSIYQPNFLKEADNLQQKLNIGSITHVSMN